MAILAKLAEGGNLQRAATFLSENDSVWLSISNRRAKERRPAEASSQAESNHELAIGLPVGPA